VLSLGRFVSIAIFSSDLTPGSGEVGLSLSRARE